MVEGQAVHKEEVVVETEAETPSLPVPEAHPQLIEEELTETDLLGESTLAKLASGRHDVETEIEEGL